jgi:DNA polymerase III delta subunit
MDLARKLHAAGRGLREGADPWALAGKLKLWPLERKEAVLAAAKRVDASRLRELLRRAVEMDQRFKSGLGDADRGMEVMAVRFAGAGTGRV